MIFHIICRKQLHARGHFPYSRRKTKDTGSQLHVHGIIPDTVSVFLPAVDGLSYSFSLFNHNWHIKTVKNKQKKGDFMATFEVNTGKKKKGDFIVSALKTGVKGYVPVIDGQKHPELTFMAVSEDDKDAACRFLEEALKATQGDIPKAMQYMYGAAVVSGSDIDPEESLEVRGHEILIDYEKRKAFSTEGEEIANLDDRSCGFSKDAVKSSLIERAEAFFDKEAEEDFDTDDEEDFSEYEDFDDDEDTYDEELDCRSALLSLLEMLFM